MHSHPPREGSLPEDHHEARTIRSLPGLKGLKTKGLKPARKALVLRVENIQGLPERWPLEAPLVGGGAAVQTVLILEPEQVSLSTLSILSHGSS